MTSQHECQLELKIKQFIEFINNRLSTEHEVLEHYCHTDEEKRHQQSRIDLLIEMHHYASTIIIRNDKP